MRQNIEIPPYDVLGEEIRNSWRDFYKDDDGNNVRPEQLGFWPFKRKLDDLLNGLVVLGSGSPFSMEEIIQAIDSLY